MTLNNDFNIQMTLTQYFNLHVTLTYIVYPPDDLNPIFNIYWQKPDYLITC